MMKKRELKKTVAFLVVLFGVTTSLVAGGVMYYATYTVPGSNGAVNQWQQVVAPNSNGTYTATRIDQKGKPNVDGSHLSYDDALHQSRIYADSYTSQQQNSSSGFHPIMLYWEI